MEILPPETLVNIFERLPYVGKGLSTRVCKYWRDVIWAYVIKNMEVCSKYVLLRDKQGNTIPVWRSIRMLEYKLGDIFSYVCESRNKALFDWFKNNVIDFTVENCWQYGINSQDIKIITCLINIYSLKITWGELCRLDLSPTHRRYIYDLNYNNIEPKIFTKFVAQPNLPVDWWEILKQVPFYYQTSYGWLLNRPLNDYGIERLKLIFAKIILETKLSVDGMFLEIAKRNIEPRAYTVLVEVYSHKIELCNETTFKLLKYPKYFAKANKMEIIPTTSIGYIIEKYDDYEEVEKAAESRDQNISLLNMINRNDKFTFRYFNSHRDAVAKYIKLLITYAQDVRSNNVLKSLNGFKNSKFSQMYDFANMKVNNTRKIFEQRKLQLK